MRAINNEAKKWDSSLGVRSTDTRAADLVFDPRLYVTETDAKEKAGGFSKTIA